MRGRFLLNKELAAWEWWSTISFEMKINKIDNVLNKNINPKDITGRELEMIFENEENWFLLSTMYL